MLICFRRAIDILEYVFNWRERRGQTGANYKRMSGYIDCHEFITYSSMKIATCKIALVKVLLHLQFCDLRCDGSIEDKLCRIIRRYLAALTAMSLNDNEDDNHNAQWNIGWDIEWDIGLLNLIIVALRPFLWNFHTHVYCVSRWCWALTYTSNLFCIV